jgi:hypothetical protein
MEKGRMRRPAYPLNQRKSTPGVLDHARRIKEWTRTAIAEGPDTVVSVTELACSKPGCPPRETVILVLSPGRAGRKASIHKCLLEVTEEDVAGCVGSLTVML